MSAPLPLIDFAKRHGHNEPHFFIFGVSLKKLFTDWCPSFFSPAIADSLDRGFGVDMAAINGEGSITLAMPARPSVSSTKRPFVRDDFHQLSCRTVRYQLGFLCFGHGYPRCMGTGT